MNVEIASRNWKYAFYAVNAKKQYVLGFTDRNECEHYCDIHQLRCIAYKTALNSGKNPRFLENWSDEFSEVGIEGELDP